MYTISALYIQVNLCLYFIHLRIYKNLYTNTILAYTNFRLPMNVESITILQRVFTPDVKQEAHSAGLVLTCPI